ncbi:TPA: flap endonuclease-1 [Candidatus Woesearchaeota archaeon]|nr:flap endonuclease-1 [Candidatus Woesearchaeota archaeon]
MGVALTSLLKPQEIAIGQLHGKVLAVDASLWLYQFLTSIRSQDGTPLADSQGNVTSHLSGLFFRTAKLMQQGLKLAFVFDGKPPELKQRTQEMRRELKQEALRKLAQAEAEGDIGGMRRFASRTARLSSEMIAEAKLLVSALGLPVVEAPSEAEAQAAHMVSVGKAYAVATQDADVLVFGAPCLVKNLSLFGRRKKAGKAAYDSVEPELITLSGVLNGLGIDHEQLIVLSMLIGCDYAPGGVRGIGPQKGLALVKQYGHDFGHLFSDVGWDAQFPYPWNEVYYTFRNIPVSDEVSLSWGGVDGDAVHALLVEKHGFSEERVGASLKKLVDESEGKGQRGLGEFL